MTLLDTDLPLDKPLDFEATDGRDKERWTHQPVIPAHLIAATMEIHGWRLTICDPRTGEILYQTTEH